MADSEALPETAAPSRSLPIVVIGALGVVFGDIGTSPLYALRQVFHDNPSLATDPRAVTGILSLILWAVVLAVCVKYTMFVMRADCDGEGGTLAMLGLIRRADPPKPYASPTALVLVVLFGSALLYGDGMITPSISVLSAVEGLGVATNALKPVVLPLAAGILVALFLVQKSGTQVVGRVFGPIMLLWFAAIGTLGVIGAGQTPAIWRCLDPLAGLGFLVSHGWQGYATLGAVVLAFSGVEALFADLGHFGRPPILLAWYFIVLPGLFLNYVGQGALVLHDPHAGAEPFYGLVPRQALYPMVALSTAATVIASQALISGAFSLTHQAVNMGLAPPYRVTHTSRRTSGQVYMPLINTLLMVGCLAIVLSFRTSDALGNAYGLAVIGTMTVTSVVFFIVTRRVWHWPLVAALPLLAAFMLFDLSFLGANLAKLLQGAWVPLAIGMTVFFLMFCWTLGRARFGRALAAWSMPVAAFRQDVAGWLSRRDGTVVFLTLDLDRVHPGGPPRLAAQQLPVSADPAAAHRNQQRGLCAASGARGGQGQRRRDFHRGGAIRIHGMAEGWPRASPCSAVHLGGCRVHPDPAGTDRPVLPLWPGGAGVLPIHAADRAVARGTLRPAGGADTFGGAGTGAIDGPETPGPPVATGLALWLPIRSALFTFRYGGMRRRPGRLASVPRRGPFDVGPFDVGPLCSRFRRRDLGPASAFAGSRRLVRPRDFACTRCFAWPGNFAWPRNLARTCCFGRTVSLCGTCRLGRTVGLCATGGLCSGRPVGKIGGPCRRWHRRPAFVHARPQFGRSSRQLAVLDLFGGRLHMRLVRVAFLFRCRPRRYAAGAVVAHAGHVDVVHHRLVINVGDVNAAEIVHGSVVRKHAAAPEAAFIAGARVAEAIVDAAIEADLRAPVAIVENVTAADEAPVTGRPQQAGGRRLYPSARHPVIAVGGVVGPISRHPEVARRRQGRLLVHGQRRRRDRDRNADANLGRRDRRYHGRSQARCGKAQGKNQRARGAAPKQLQLWHKLSCS